MLDKEHRTSYLNAASRILMCKSPVIAQRGNLHLLIPRVFGYVRQHHGASPEPNISFDRQESPWTYHGLAHVVVSSPGRSLATMDTL